jgi:hypothetical protein
VLQTSFLEPDMTKTHRKSTDTLGVESPERERLMVDLSIGFDGLRYEYNGYRYDALADAANYARLMRSRPLQADPGGSFMQSARVDAPSDADRKLMTALAIEYDAGVYRFDGYRYDRLADAVTYAKLSARRRPGLT